MIELAAILSTPGPDFVSRPVDAADLVLGGIAGDLHAGPTRDACARTPWHKRSTPIANTRQLSIVSVEECREIARLMGLAELDPGLLGANLVIEGQARLSALPPATRLQFPSGATVFVTEENQPCAQPAGKIAAAYGDARLRAAFARAALGRRGLVALVERAGRISTGDAITMIPVSARREPASIAASEAAPRIT